MFAIFLFDRFSDVLSKVQNIAEKIPNAEFSRGCSDTSAMISLPWNEAINSGLFEIAARCPSCSYLPDGGGFFVPAYRVYGQKVLKSDSLVK